MWIGACKGFSYGFRDFHPSIANFVVFVWHSWLCVSFADLGQTSRTISGVDRVREQGPSRTPSPSVGSFQDMAARRPRQDVPMMHRVTPPQLSRCHIPNEEQLMPFEIPLSHKSTYMLSIMILSYPRPMLMPLPMSCRFWRDAQNPETTNSGRRSSPAGTRRSMGGWREKKASNVFSHRRGMCASPCKMWTSLRNGELVDPVPGGVLNHRPPPILRVWLLISPLTMMAKERNPRRISMKHRSFQSSVVGGRNPRLIVSYERPRPKLTARTQVSGWGRRGRLLPRGAFLPGPGLPSEEGLREREILGVTLL